MDDTKIVAHQIANDIWSIANTLRGVYSSDKYKDVIIPMTIIRRFDCDLKDTKGEVDAIVKQFKSMSEDCPDEILKEVAKRQYYNISGLSLDDVCQDSTIILQSFRKYLNGFSPSIKKILDSLKFDTQVIKMNDSNLLLPILNKFRGIDLDPKTISSANMGYAFEELIRKFSENAEAGDHYTGRDIIDLMVDLAFNEASEEFNTEMCKSGKIIKVLDQAAGTGGMLTKAYHAILEKNPDALVELYAQEINDESYAICLAELLIKLSGMDSSVEEKVQCVDSMRTDCFPETEMQLVLENPPFGCAWGGEDAPKETEKAVREEAEKPDGRFPAGVPAIGDMQMLFMQAAIQKLNPYGRAVIVSNGSPLFAGETKSGESKIRKWLITNDYVETIVQLSPNMFYNTGIVTYLWVLTKQKAEKRKGKIQLIDASSFVTKLRKPLGNKKNEISIDNRLEILGIHTSFTDNEYSKVFTNEDFLYREVTLMQPMQRKYSVTSESIDRLLSGTSLNSLYSEAKVYDLEAKEKLKDSEKKTLDKMRANAEIYQKVEEVLRANISSETYDDPKAFTKVIDNLLTEILPEKKQRGEWVKKIVPGLSVMDKSAKIQTDAKNNIVYDTETKDTELIPYTVDIDTYMQDEVLPHVPDAVVVAGREDANLVGAEIPFTRYFYKYTMPESSAVIAKRILETEKELAGELEKLFAEEVV